MRFVKLFIFALLALVGALGVIIGVMYVTGGLKPKVVAPENIMFEFANVGETEFNLSNDTFIKVTTSTVDVTETKVTLSLPAQQIGSQNGITYITDGIIKVPQTVWLNQPFKVELIQAENPEISQSWIKGGISALTAKSSALEVTPIQTRVNVDVPVHSVEVETYSNPTYSAPVTSFASGELFYAKAKFLPSASQYRYSQDGSNARPAQTKKVFFNVVPNVQEDAETISVNNQLKNDGITNIKAFKVTEAKNIAISAHAFETAAQEDKQLTAGATDAEALEILVNNPALDITEQAAVEVQNLVIGSFEIASSNIVKTLEFNKQNKIFANKASNNFNFGIAISSHNVPTLAPNLQHKIKSVGVSVLAKIDDNFLRAPASYFEFIDGENNKQQPYSVGGMEFYLPIAVAGDINQSYWNFKPLIPNVEFAFCLAILNEERTALEKEEVIYTATSATNKLQTWQSGAVVPAQIAWQNHQSVVLNVIDGENPTSQEYEPYNNLVFRAGTYSNYAFLVYCDAEFVLTSVIAAAEVEEMASSVATTLGLINGKVYKFKSQNPVIKPLPSSTVQRFYLVAAVFEDDGQTIHAHSQVLTVNVEKTVKSFSAYIQVPKSAIALIKNAQNAQPEVPVDPGEEPQVDDQPVEEQPQIEDDPLQVDLFDLEEGDGENPQPPVAEGDNADGKLKFLAFVQGTDKHIFSIVFKIEAKNAEEKANLDNEIAIFERHFGQKINLIVQTTNQLSRVVVQKTGIAQKDEDSWTYTIPFYTLDETLSVNAKDAGLSFQVAYQQTQTEATVQEIDEVYFEPDENIQPPEFDADNHSDPIIQIYDGKVAALEFKHDTKQASLIKKVNITAAQGDEGWPVVANGPRIYMADEISVSYTYQGEPTTVLDSNGNYLVVAKDKFGQIITDVDLLVTQGTDTSATAEKRTYDRVQASNYSSSLSSMPYVDIYVVQEEQMNAQFTVGVNQGEINNGEWSSSDIKKGFDAPQSQSRLSVDRYAKSGSVINLTGEEGLLSVIYSFMSNDEKYFQLCNKLTYEFQSAMSAYDGVLDYNSTNHTITVLQSINAPITLYLDYNTQLGQKYNVALNILPNFTAQISAVSQINGQEVACSEIQEGDQTFFVVYSDVATSLNIKFYYTLTETLTIKMDNVSLGPITFGANEENTISFSRNFGKDNIGDIFLELTTDGAGTNVHIYRQTIAVRVFANAQFVGESKQTLNKDITIAALNNAGAHNVLNINTDVARVMETEEEFGSAAEDFHLELSRVIDQNTNQEIESNIFELYTDMADWKIKATSTLYGTYVAYITVYYGQKDESQPYAHMERLGEIVLTIKPPVTPAPNQTSRFAYIDDKMYVLFVAGESFASTDLAEWFNNESAVDFTTNNMYVTTDTTPAEGGNPETTSYQILSHIAQQICPHTSVVNVRVTYTNEGELVAEVTYPVCFMPFGTDYVKYKDIDTPSYEIDGFVDLAKMTNVALLQNICDEYASGTDANLFQTAEKQYGMSQRVLDIVQGNNLPYAILLAGQHGELTQTPYPGVFNVNNGTLQTLPRSEDMYAYFVLYDNQFEKNILGLYHFVIKANSAINVYYPYANPSQQTTLPLAEYVTKPIAQNLEIDFDEIMSGVNPNHGHKRVQLDVCEDGEYTRSLEQYDLQVEIVSLTNFSAHPEVTETSKLWIEHTYGAFVDGTKLVITNSEYENAHMQLVLNITLSQNQIELGQVTYVVVLNSPEARKLFVTENNTNYTETNKTIPSGSSFDFANKIINMNLSQETSTPLPQADWGVHYYLVSVPEDTNTFIARTGNTLQLSSKAVSDKKVNFVFYTIYGIVHQVQLTFVSGYSVELANNGVITNNGGQFEVFSDQVINLATAFVIKDASGAAKDLSEVDFDCTVSAGSVYAVNGNELTFGRILESYEMRHITLTACLSEASLGVEEDYTFEFDLKVKQSISPNHNQTALAIAEDFNVSYKSAGYTFNQLIKAADNPTSDIDFLFTELNSGALAGYSLHVETPISYSSFISFDPVNEELGVTSTTEKTFDPVSYTGLYTNFPIYLLKAPAESLTIPITFRLKKWLGEEANAQEVSIQSVLNLTVRADIQITLTYPQPSATSNLQKEVLLLPSDHYKGGSKLTFNFDDQGYFATNRVMFTSASSIDGRIKYRFTSDGNVLINSETTTTIQNGADCDIVWNSNEAVQGIWSARVRIEVLVDDEVRPGADYFVEFENDVNRIFAISRLNNLYQQGQPNSAVNKEMFFVETGNTEKIFSKNTALITFTNQPQPEPVTLTAYINGIIAEKITIGTSTKTNYWVISSTSHEIKPDLSNVTVQKNTETEKYNFKNSVTEPSSVYHSLFSGNATVTYRLTATYLGQELDASKTNDLFTCAGDVTTGRLGGYTISTEKEAHEKEITFKYGNDNLLAQKYYFEVVYDFVAPYAYSTQIGQVSANSTLFNIVAPNTLSGMANSALGISGITGEFNQEYFTKHNVNYRAEIAMITNANFETEQTANNVKYLPSETLWLMQNYFPNVTAVNLPSSRVCAAIAPATFQKTIGSTSTETVYDFAFKALGAENNGNYVYVLVTYGVNLGITSQADANKCAFALFKIKVMPTVSCMALYNTPNGIENTSGQPKRIEYDADNEFADIVLGKYGHDREAGDLVYIFGENAGAANAKNLLGDGIITPIATGDIADYVEIVTSGDEVVLRQKDGAYAHYGDKSGSLLISDAYGYTVRYYIVLKAQKADKALSLALMEETGTTFINPIPNTVNNFFTGTAMKIVDISFNEELGEMSAIRVHNWQDLMDEVTESGGGTTFTVSYSIPELNFNTVPSPMPDETFELPNIEPNFMVVTLEIRVAVDCNNTTEEVLLSTTIGIQKRFAIAVLTENNSSVQAGVAFNVGKFLTVNDRANQNVDVGSASVISKTFTLIVKAEHATKQIVVNATHREQSALNITGIQITVGKDFDGKAMTAVATEIEEEDAQYYYYPLAMHPRLQGIDFEAYDFIVSSAASGFDVEANCELLPDVLVSLTTVKLNSNPDTVYVKINNGADTYNVPFALNKNGVQTKSLCEVIASGQLNGINTGVPLAVQPTGLIVPVGKTSTTVSGASAFEASIPATQAIYNFNLALDPVSASDLTKLKNFKVYNDNIVLKITKPENFMITNLTFGITVKDQTTGNILASKNNFVITENYSHYRYISLFNLLGKQFNINATYTIELKYLVRTNSVPSGTDVITFKENSTKTQRNIDQMTEYTVSTSFEISESNNIDITENNENIEAFSKDAFVNNGSITTKEYSVIKYYVVKYEDNGLYEGVSINYKVTPKYYGVSDNTTMKNIYANQYEVKFNHTGNYYYYEVDFNTWASSVDLVDYAGNVLSSLTAATGLTFTCGAGESIGAVTLNADKTICTTSNFNINDQFAQIEIWAPVNDKEKINIGYVQLKFDPNNVYVAHPAEYMFIITNPKKAISGTSINSTIIASYDFKTNGNNPSVHDLIFANPSELLVGLVDADKHQVRFNGEPCDINKCNIEIVTVIDRILSVKYETIEANQYLTLTFRLNETQSSANKSVNLTFLGRHKNNPSITASSDEKNENGINITIGTQIIEENEAVRFEIRYNGVPVTDAWNDDLAAYQVQIPFTDAFSGIIGEEYNFNAIVNSCDDANSQFLYAKRPADFDETALHEGDLLLFTLMFNDNEETHYALLAVKWSEDNGKLLSKEGSFTLDMLNLEDDGKYTIDGVEVLTGEDGIYSNKMDSFVITYIGTQEMNNESLGAGSNILLCCTPNASTKYYSIAQVIGDPNNGVCDLKLNGKDIYDQIVSNGTLEFTVYGSDVISDSNKSLPSVVPVGLGANQTGYYKIYTYGSNQHAQFAIFKPTAENVNLPIASSISDYGKYGGMQDYVVVETIASAPAGISALTPPSPIDPVTYWQLNIVNGVQVNGVQVIKSVCTYTTGTDYTLYMFDENIGKLNTSQFENLTYISSQVDLSALVGTNPQDGYYFFTCEYTVVEGTETVTKTATFVAKCVDGKVLVNVGALNFGESTSITITRQYEQISANQMNYVTLTIDSSKAFYAYYLSNSTSISNILATGLLSDGAIGTYEINSTGFENYIAANCFTLFVTAKDELRTFEIGGTETPAPTFEVAAQATSITYTETISLTNDLTISLKVDTIEE